jgi:pimeloyl-ACP methyl ester carboxylesterase
MRLVRLAAALLAVAATAFALLGAPAAEARLRFERCTGFVPQCARLAVPLDRSGATPGRVSLFVGRFRARERPRRGAVFTLAGGPGQSATAAFGGDGLGVLGRALRRRDLIVFDQRGTGRSGLLRCRALERADLFDAGPAAGACARRLGARRHHYTTRASVDDIEAIRRELGVPRITLYGTSYGVKVALGYALTYPGNVERLLLDSVVEPDGLDPFYLPSLAAVPRVLRALCGTRCSSFTRDPLADLGALVRRMAPRPLRGYAVDRRGRRRSARLTRGELFLILLGGDFDPQLRAAFPGAVRAALDGDAAPALRLKRRAFSDGGPLPARLISVTLFAATICEETPFPWARTAAPDPAERRRLAAAALTSIPAGAFLPFDRGTTLQNDLLQLCDQWTAAPAAPSFGPGPLPDVPVLLLAGEDDLRTPVENARRVAARFPRSRLLVASATGHSALAGESTGCLERAVVRFLRNQPVPRRCRRARRPVPPLPPPPRRLRDVQPTAGVRGVRGRALGALALTLRDVAEDLSYTDLAGGGLRGGRYRFDDDSTLNLRRVAFVPGVRVSGRLRLFSFRRQRGQVRLSGPATPDGLLLVRGRRISGRLGGRPVSARLAVPSGIAAAARRAVPPPSRRVPARG